MKFLTSRYILFMLLVIIMLEVAFRVGVYESMVSPYSHSGTTITLKKALGKFGKDKVNVATFGDSRAAQGLDNRTIYKASREFDLVHLKMSMPGSHFLTLKALASWSLDELTELRGIVVAVSPGNFRNIGNGAYELAKVLPLRNETSVKEMFQHVPFKSTDVRTYAPLYSVGGYREDIKNLLKDPAARLEAVGKRNQRDALNFLAYTGAEETDLCAASTHDPVKCLEELQQPNSDIPKRARNGLKYLCKVAMRQKSDAAPGQAEQRLIDEWVLFLESLSSKVQVMLVILPDHSILQEHVYTPRAMFVTRSVVERVQQKGVIQVVDLHELIVDQKEPECSFYLDSRHLNKPGKRLLTEALLPSLEEFWGRLQ